MEMEQPHLAIAGWTVVSPQGEVDVATAPALREALLAVLADGGTKMVVDLEGVDFLDSTGLGVLLGALRRARGAGGDLRLVCTNARILKVFDITGLRQVFTVADSVEAAVTAPVPPAGE